MIRSIFEILSTNIKKTKALCPNSADNSSHGRASEHPHHHNSNPWIWIMTLSDLSGWSNFGFLVAVAFIWALLADFFFAPTVMMLLKPLKAEKVSSGQVNH